jgi:hypothetical protein
MVLRLLSGVATLRASQRLGAVVRGRARRSRRRGASRRPHGTDEPRLRPEEFYFRALPEPVHDPRESHGSRCSAVPMTWCSMGKERGFGAALSIRAADRPPWKVTRATVTFGRNSSLQRPKRETPRSMRSNPKAHLPSCAATTSFHSVNGKRSWPQNIATKYI